MHDMRDSIFYYLSNEEGVSASFIACFCALARSDVLPRAGLLCSAAMPLLERTRGTGRAASLATTTSVLEALDTAWKWVGDLEPRFIPTDLGVQDRSGLIVSDLSPVL